MRLRTYGSCVKALQKQGLSRRQIAGLIGIDEAVLSRRMAKKQAPTVEALIVINTLAEVFSPGDDTGPLWDQKGWMAEKIKQASDLHDLGKVA